MFGGGKGMGGGGGSMLRVVGRAVTSSTTRAAGVANLQETLPPSSSSTSSSSSTAVTSPKKSRPTHRPNLILSSAAAHPPPTYYGWSSAGSCCDDFEWVSVDDVGYGGEDQNSFALLDDFTLSPVPSLDEVHSAVSALTHAFDAPTYSQLVRDKFACNGESGLSDQISSPSQLLRRDASVGSKLDWMEPSPYIYNPGMLHPYGPQRVYDAFQLLQTEPSVQRMVMSLSSDEAVWNAVLNNSVVRELRETFYADRDESEVSPPASEVSEENRDESNPAMDFVRWIFDNTRAKVVELIETITNLVNQLVKPPCDEKAREGGAMDPFEERLRSSFMLSIVVLLIVVVTRAPRG